MRKVKKIIEVDFDENKYPKANYDNPDKIYITEDTTYDSIKRTFPVITEKNKPKMMNYRKGNDAEGYEYLLRIPMSFDIETTNTESGAYMYHWQFGIQDRAYMGRTWKAFQMFLSYVIKFYDLGEQDGSYPKHWRRAYRNKNNLVYAPIWVANLPYEWQFMRKHIPIDNLFADKDRKPLNITTHAGAFKFYDALRLSGGSLKALAEDYCTTQKLAEKDDNDKPLYNYDKLRNSKTKMTDFEIQYCVNDVITLTEFADYMYRTYLEQYGKIPLTKTQIIGNAIKESFAEWELPDTIINLAKNDNIGLKKNDTHGWIRQMQVQSFHEYQIVVGLLYRGGFTHGNISHFNKRRRAKGRDFTSSYPNEMMRRMFPVTPFVDVTVSNFEDLKVKGKGRPFYGMFTFDKIKAKTMHSIESKHKICQYHYKDENFQSICKPVFDNGRLIEAEHITVWLTDVDLKVYEMFYEWESVSVSQVKMSRYGRLPSYITDIVKHFYKMKKKLKDEGLEDAVAYRIAKAAVNSIYGKCVQQIHVAQMLYDGTTEDSGFTESILPEEITEEDYLRAMCLDAESVQKGKLPNGGLCPYFGIWITAWARFDLLRTVARLGNDALYCDTDSIYYQNPEQNEHIFKEYNEQIYANNAKLVADGVITKEEVKYFGDLGEFDVIKEKGKDGKKYDEFIFIQKGAKRYTKRLPDGTDLVTIAGLPKGAMQKYSDERGFDLQDLFIDDEENLKIPVEYANKLCSIYIDKENAELIIDDEGNREIMTEKTSVILNPIGFEMNIGDIYALAEEVENSDKFTQRKDIIYYENQETEENYLY